MTWHGCADLQRRKARVGWGKTGKCEFTHKWCTFCSWKMVRVHSPVLQYPIIPPPLISKALFFYTPTLGIWATKFWNQLAQLYLSGALLFFQVSNNTCPFQKEDLLLFNNILVLIIIPLMNFIYNHLLYYRIILEISYKI